MDERYEIYFELASERRQHVIGADSIASVRRIRKPVGEKQDAHRFRDVVTLASPGPSQRSNCDPHRSASTMASAMSAATCCAPRSLKWRPSPANQRLSPPI